MTYYMIRREGEAWFAYWVPGMVTPNKRPECCEIRESARRGYWAEDTNPAEMWRHLRRWPNTAHEAKTALFCQLHGVTVPDGWKVVGFRVPEIGETYLCRILGREFLCEEYEDGPRPILHKVEEKCEHKSFGLIFGDDNKRSTDPVTAHRCHDCGMVRRLGEWEEDDE